jgi:hypothetical protein
MSQLSGAGTLLSEQARLQSLTRTRAEEISHAIDHAAGLGTFYTSAIRQRELLASQLADRGSMISRTRDAMGSMIGASGARRVAWGDSIKQFLNPGISTGLLASMIGAQRGASVSDAIELAAGLSRGFRTTANVGLAGLGPRGAASEVLRNYRAEWLDHSDIFRDVMTGIEGLDADDLNDAELSEGVNKARRIAQGIDINDPAQAQTILSLIMLLLMVYAIILQQEAIDVAKLSATSADVATATAEMRGLRDDLTKAREEERREWREIRFIAKVTPLRAEADSRSMELLDIYPDQLLRVIEVNGAWARVEVIPYSSDRPVSGWINRTHLRASPN